MKSQKAKTIEHPRHGYIRRANNYTCLFARHVSRQTKHSKTLIDREGTPVYQTSCTGNVIKGNSEAVCLDQISCHLALAPPILFDVELRFRHVGGHEHSVLFGGDLKIQLAGRKRLILSLRGSRKHEERTIAFDRVADGAFPQHKDQGIEWKRNRLKDRVIA